MSHWISGLISRKQSNPVDKLTLAAVFSDKNIRVDLKERPLPCGHLAYWIIAYWYSEDSREWIELACVHESDLEPVMRLLKEAQDYVREI